MSKIIVPGFTTQSDFPPLGNPGLLYRANGTLYMEDDNSSRSVLSVPHYDIRAKGASPSESASTNTTAITNTINDAQNAGGGKIVLPPGTWPIHTDSLSISNDNISFVGCGYGISILQPVDASGDVINITSDANKIFIRDIGFIPSVTRTGGSDINCDGYEVGIQRCNFIGSYTGVTFGTTNSVMTIGRCVFTNLIATNGTGILVDTPGADLTITEILMNNASAIKAGINVRRCSDVTISGCNIINSGFALLVDPVTSEIVASIYASDTFFDNSTAGAYFNGANGGSIVRGSFTQCWFSANSTHGVYIDTSSAGTINGLQFLGCFMHLNSTHGIGVVGANSNDIDIVGGAMSENGGSGVALGSGVDGVTVQGVRSGAFHGLNGNDYGIFFDSSLSNIRVLDNNFSGNDTADFAYSSLAGLEIRGNTGLVTENSGTGTITSGNTSVTVSHGLSVTPNAQDFSIVFTEQATNDYGRWWISNITSTQFDLNVSSDPGASNLDFSWNIKAWSL